MGNTRSILGRTMMACDVVLTGMRLATALGVLGLSSHHAAGADRQPPADPAPAASSAILWSGLYIGAAGGYGWGGSETCAGRNSPPCQPRFPHFDITGGTLGGTAGYNWQVGRTVLGVEADVSWADIKGQSLSIPGPAGFGPVFGCGAATDTCLTSMTALVTVRGRFGMALGRFMPYVTAGAAFVRMHGEIGQTFSPGAAHTAWFTRPAAGLGMEYAFTSNWSSKVEYLGIFDIGDHAFDVVGACGTPGCFSRTGTVNLVRAGINYRF